MSYFQGTGTGNQRLISIMMFESRGYVVKAWFTNAINVLALVASVNSVIRC